MLSIQKIVKNYADEKLHVGEPNLAHTLFHLRSLANIIDKDYTLIPKNNLLSKEGYLVFEKI